MLTKLNLEAGAQDLYDAIAKLPIVSPHGHCAPEWFARNIRFGNPSELIIIPDHYVFRLLYSQGVSLEDLGIGVPAEQRDPRAIFRIFAQHWHLFLGTPTRLWIDFMLRRDFGIRDTLTPENADLIYDHIDVTLKTPDFKPRALFERFGIEVLATTDSATATLADHALIKSSWTGRVIPTFRPDSLLDPSDSRFDEELDALANASGLSVDTYVGFLDALRSRRTFFKERGATATDHAVESLSTEWLRGSEIEALYSKARSGKMTRSEALRFQGHMLCEMAQMSAEDGLVMQLHAGARRNTNRALFKEHGPDMGADMPVRTGWVRGLEPLLNRVGNDPSFRLIAFTLDETSYARELAPLAGHWPCLRLGPPWWFHDSFNGILRFLDNVVETAGYANLSGFVDDTRAFMSIPARHDLWRRAVATHLHAQINRGFFSKEDATRLAELLSVGLARDAYRLERP